MGSQGLKEDPMVEAPSIGVLQCLEGSGPVLNWRGARNSWPWTWTGWNQKVPASNMKNPAPVILIFSEFNQIWLFLISLSLLLLAQFSAEHHKPTLETSEIHGKWLRVCESLIWAHHAPYGPASLTGWSRILFLDLWTPLPTVCY